MSYRKVQTTKDNINGINVFSLGQHLGYFNKHFDNEAKTAEL